MKQSTPSVCLSGGLVLSPFGELNTGDVHVADGQIVGAWAEDAQVIDCAGCHVLPGIVDVHGDAFELELHPRPGLDIPYDIAMTSVDRQLLSNGITTAYHGLTVSWEPGARGLGAAHKFMDGLAALQPRLVADHRVQLRWEVFAHDAMNDIKGWLTLNPTPAIAFNNHTTVSMAAFRDGEQRKLEKWATRAGITLAEYRTEVDRAMCHAPDVPEMIREMAEHARQNGAVLLAHDEMTRDERLRNRALGMTISEFPMSADVAADATQNGEHVVMGGPNAIRGGSHNNSMTAQDAIREGQCTILASDYYYPSLLHAAERLVTTGVTTLASAWALVSANPAAAMGLTDRGAIEIGRRADLIVVDGNGPWRLRHTVAGGVVTSFG